MTHTAKLLLLFGFASCPVFADDWPQFGGEDRDARSSESGLLQTWPEEGPPLVWSVQGVGMGYSSVAVVEDRIYTIGDEAEDQLVFALNRDDGSLVWKTRIGPANSGGYAGSRSTPRTQPPGETCRAPCPGGPGR